MALLHINHQNFSELEKSEKKVLIDFYADWCGPCRMLSPIVEELAAENPQYVVAKVNVDNEPELANRFGVFSIPTLVVLRNGQVVDQAVGAQPKARILAMLEK